MDPSLLATGFSTQPLAYGFAVALAAVAYLYKQNIDTQLKMLELVQKMDADHRATIEKIIPLCVELTKYLETLESGKTK